MGKGSAALFFLLFAWMVSAQEKTEIFFDFNKDEPNEASATALRNWIDSHPKAEIMRVFGYCDSTDANTYNKQLSERRINSVVKMLRDSGIPVNAEMKAFGEDFKQTRDAAKNRKVEVYFRMPAKTEEKKAAAAQPVPETEPDEAFRAGQQTEIQTLERKLLKAKTGETVRLDHIIFYRNSEKMIPESEPLLEALYRILVRYPKLKIEIQGHICCNPNTFDTKLSYRRAKFIFDWLRENDIALHRLGYKGFGSANPIYRIPEETAEQQRANRRVEILIKEN